MTVGTKGTAALIFTVAALLCLLFIELSLQLASLASSQVESVLARPRRPISSSPTVPDERLGYRPNPAYPGHDERGFRNAETTDAAHVVALGDSQTYGTGVKPEEAWPRQLERLLEESVYSMAYGGYGPTHSLLLWDEAISLSPEIVIEAFYSGNDLYDSFNLVYNNDQLPELKSHDPQITGAILNAESTESLEERVTRIYRMGRDPTLQDRTDPPARWLIRTWLSEHSGIYGLLRRTKYELNRLRKDEWEAAKASAEVNSQYTQVYEDELTRTVFTSEYRLSALDLDDPRIREGERISLEAISRMHELAESRGIRFIVLLIPTKELVHSRRAAGVGRSTFQALISQEARLWRETMAFLDRRSIEYIDALPPLQAKLDAGPQPYPPDHGGHPNAEGHRVIAETINARLISSGR